jgi:hypothetical protein
MRIWLMRLVTLLAVGAMGYLGVACRQEAGRTAPPATSAEVTTRGAIEVTAQLVEIPQGAIFKRDLYDYATVLRYKIIKVHRGQPQGETILVGQYNPFKPRSEAADGRVKEIGGDLKRFEAGQVHRLALDVPIEDHFMGGIVNKYFGQSTNQIYWAVWTDLAE